MNRFYKYFLKIELKYMKGSKYILAGVGLVIIGVVVYAIKVSNSENAKPINIDTNTEVGAVDKSTFNNDSQPHEQEDDIESTPDDTTKDLAEVFAEAEAKDSNMPKVVDVTGLKKGGIADALLTKDALMGVVLELTLAGCDKYDSHQAYILKNPIMISEIEGSWQERWVVSGCGNKYQVDFNFHEIIGQGTDWAVLK